MARSSSVVLFNILSYMASKTSVFNVYYGGNGNIKKKNNNYTDCNSDQI